MARKGKRRQAARARRTSPPGPRPPAAAPGAGAATRQQVGGDQTLVHAVEMSLAPSTKPAPRRSGRLVLESTDPAIPLDRVPFLISDLKRVGVVMVIMVALLVAGAELIIPRLIA